MAYPTIPSVIHNYRDLYIDQFASFQDVMTVVDVSGSMMNIVSWSFTGSIREQPASAQAPVISQFSITSFPAVSSSVSFSLTPVSTSVLTKQRYVYDIIGTNPSTVPPTSYRILQGKVYVSLGVTTNP